uniref:BY PROTMAP: gi/342320101/gb/EGU12044.1/ Proteophosphoglycan ppg4 [Rhodotorula glutinis ATCC 204091] n=1 Tax=Rhodotorula toruloides TaxID=5286 RepID=A0A0K3CFU0_RHOTO
MAALAAQNAAKPLLVKQTVEGSFHHTITCDLDLNLMDPDLDERFELDGVPLAGNWTCDVDRRADCLDIALNFGALSAGRWGPQIRVVLRFFYLRDGQQVPLEEAAWERCSAPWLNPRLGVACNRYLLDIPLSKVNDATAASSSAFIPVEHRAYRLIIDIHSRPTKPPLEAVRLIRRMPDTDLSAFTHDVRLFFPRQDADLWAKSSVLARASPYLKTLLASDFAESVAVPQKRKRTAGVTAGTAAPAAANADALASNGQGFEDSDDETDELYFEKHPTLQHERDELQHPFKVIKITATAFTTYRAVLAYLRTGFIAFAPLSSTLPVSDATDISTRKSRIEAAISANSSLPYPVSPKSTYRLAHLLEIASLQTLCLANLSKQLTTDCAPTELFSDACVCYDAWRNVVLDYIVKNCDAVTKSAAWTEATSRVERDEVPGAAPIMLELFKRKVLKTANPAPTPLEHKLVKFDLEGHFHYTFTVDLELDLSDPKLNKEFALEGIESLGTRPTSEAEVLIRRMPALDLAATPQNIRLFFPRHEADLWTDSSFLSRSSPYLKTLLSSDFAESVTVPSKHFDDSDEEADELYFEAHPPSQHERDELQQPYKEIKITKTAFTTYRAVLAYLRTGFIAFAPLSSTFPADADAAKPTRASRIEAAVSSDPSLPYPVSPKSTFRLAHLLELDELQHFCLANFSKQLTVDCAPYELFSDTSICYDAWRKVVLDFIVDNWDAVTSSASWKTETAKVRLREDHPLGRFWLR